MENFTSLGEKVSPPSTILRSFNKTKDWALVHERELFRGFSYIIFEGLEDKIAHFILSSLGLNSQAQASVPGGLIDFLTFYPLTVSETTRQPVTPWSVTSKASSRLKIKRLPAFLRVILAFSK